MILGYVLGWFITIEAEKIQVQTYWMRFYLWKWGPRRPFCFLLGPATRGVARSGLREKLKVYTHTYPYAKNQRVCIFCPVGPFDDTFLFTYASSALLRLSLPCLVISCVDIGCYIAMLIQEASDRPNKYSYYINHKDLMSKKLAYIGLFIR